ncbi:MAG TPA: metallophosphoesterase [Candidatus Binatia bacterium]|nr:metallophosphoesterase [Candidatus Binatia bacterium]
MTRRVSLVWDDPRPFRSRDGRPIRILAASDEPDRALDVASNREALGRIDLVVGAGDLTIEQVQFLGDAFRAPLLYVLGNHDRSGAWPALDRLPEASSGIVDGALPNVRVLALPWPTAEDRSSKRDEGAAWRQVLRALGHRLLLPGGRPWLVISHVPPRDAGDTPDDPYHVGFAAYRVVLQRLHPRLWIHGHTTWASSHTPIVDRDGTTLINVTGSALIELRPSSPR